MAARTSFCSFAILLLFSSIPLAAQLKEYRIIELRRAATNVGRLNNKGVVVGNAFASQTPPTFQWQEGRFTTLFSSESRWFEVGGLSENNVVVGAIGGGTPALAAAYLIGDESYFVPLTHPSLVTSMAKGVNAERIIVGYWMYDNQGVGINRPFIYDAIRHDLLTFDFPGQAVAINDSGYVAFFRRTSDSAATYIYRDGMFTYLPSPNSPLATDINNRREVIADELVKQGPIRGVRWRDGVRYPLDELFPPLSTHAAAINDSGVVVGYAVNQEGPQGESGDLYFAVRWKDGVRTDLNTTISPCRGVYLRGALDINNAGEILCIGRPNGASLSELYYYLLVPEKPRIVAPAQGEIWISGETDTIRWTDSWCGKLVRLDYSTDDGTTYKLVADSVAVDSNRYAWKIPRGLLSTKCRIRMLEVGTLDFLAESERFKMKGYILTRYTPEGDFYPYQMNADRWGFGNDSVSVWPEWWFRRFNYRGIDPYTQQQYSQTQGHYAFARADSSTFPDWISFVRTFLPVVCYWDTREAAYSAIALIFWDGIRGTWGGSCFGMATSNALAFEREGEFRIRHSGFPPYTTPISVLPDSMVLPVINELQVHQFGKYHQAYLRVMSDTTNPTETVQALKQTLTYAGGAKILVIINNGTGGGAHAILPYKLERDSVAPRVWKISVYDNSYPAAAEAVIDVDTSANGRRGIWTPRYGWHGWGGDEGLFLMDSASAYLAHPLLLKSRPSRSPFLPAAGTMMVMNITDASIGLRDDQGRVTGFIGNRIVTEIPGSAPLMALTGREIPPFGYTLPSGRYDVEIADFLTATSRASFFSEERVTVFSRGDAAPGQTDHLVADGAGKGTLSVANRDNQPKIISLRTIARETSCEKAFDIDSLHLGGGDSLSVVPLDNERLRLERRGSAGDYDLHLEKISAEGVRAFAKKGIPLPSNSSHTFLPNWQELEKEELAVLVDLDNDGTPDDTLHLKNELTGANDRGSLIHGEYRLYQNYPNPFNPLTVVSYQLPVASDVRLVVFDLLGREISTLVNERKKPGRYEVTFDASGLSSGVYLYRLTAGTIVQTRKMVLIR